MYCKTCVKRSLSKRPKIGYQDQLSQVESIAECSLLLNIYILNVAALDETIIPSCLHFSMQNIEQSRGLGRASRWSNVNVNQ